MRDGAENCGAVDVEAGSGGFKPVSPNVCVHRELLPPRGCCLRCRAEFLAGEAERVRADEMRNAGLAKVANRCSPADASKARRTRDVREWLRFRNAADQAILAALLAMDGDAVSRSAPRDVSARVPGFGRPDYEEWAMARIESALLRTCGSPWARERMLDRLEFVYLENGNLRALGQDWPLILVGLKHFRDVVAAGVREFPFDSEGR